MSTTREITLVRHEPTDGFAIPATNNFSRFDIGGANKKTLAEIIVECGMWDANIKHIPLDKDSITFNDEGLACGNQVFFVDDACRRTLLKNVGAQPDYFKKKHTLHLVASVLQELARGGWFGKRPVAVVNDDHLITLIRGELISLTYADVLTVIPTALGHDSDGMFAPRLQRNYEGLELDLVSTIRTTDVRVGDAVAAGLHVMHAPWGRSATTIDAFVYRKVCSNGLITKECIGRHRARARRLTFDNLDARERQREQICRLVQHQWKRLEDQLDKLTATTEKPAHVDDLLTRWLQRAKISVHETLPLLMQAWSDEGGENTVWGAVNAITRVATHNTDISVRQRRILASLAGLLAFADVHLCDRCWSLIAASPSED